MNRLHMAMAFRNIHLIATTSAISRSQRTLSASHMALTAKVASHSLHHKQRLIPSWDFWIMSCRHAASKSWFHQVKQLFNDIKSTIIIFTYFHNPIHIEQSNLWHKSTLQKTLSLAMSSKWTMTSKIPMVTWLRPVHSKCHPICQLAIPILLCLWKLWLQLAVAWQALVPITMNFLAYLHIPPYSVTLVYLTRPTVALINHSCHQAPDPWMYLDTHWPELLLEARLASHLAIWYWSKDPMVNGDTNASHALIPLPDQTIYVNISWNMIPIGPNASNVSYASAPSLGRTISKDIGKSTLKGNQLLYRNTRLSWWLCWIGRLYPIPPRNSSTRNMYRSTIKSVNKTHRFDSLCMFHINYSFICVNLYVIYLLFFYFYDVVPFQFFFWDSWISSYHSLVYIIR